MDFFEDLTKEYKNEIVNDPEVIEIGSKRALRYYTYYEGGPRPQGGTTHLVQHRGKVLGFSIDTLSSEKCWNSDFLGSEYDLLSSIEFF